MQAKPRPNWFYINGKFFNPSNRPTFSVVNPTTEEVMYEMPLGNKDDVDTCVAAAKKAFETFSLTTRDERISLLEKIIAVYEKNIALMGELISREMGAPLEFAIKSQAGAGFAHLKTFARELKEYPFEEQLGKAIIVKEPIGVCGLITPWNWPMNQVALKVGAALSAGCTMVLKPSEYTPSSATLFAEILHEAGVPPGVFNLVHGTGPEVGRAMSSHPDISMMSFTGSTRAGIDVAQKSAPTVKRVAQELGGKSANIILDDDNFAKGVKKGTVHCFGNCGQSCNAPTRMLVPRNRMEEAAKVASEVAASTVNGPVVNKIQFEKIQGLIQKGTEEATLVCGGTGRPEGKDKGFFIKPTVFSNVTNEMTIAQEEIFGPVLCILPYDSVDEAIAIGNDSPYGSTWF